MINLPYNAPLMSAITPGHGVPMQTSHNVQTGPSVAFARNLQDPLKQQPLYQFHRQDMLTNHQYIPNLVAANNPCQPIFQTTGNIAQSVQPNAVPLPQNILDQIRGYAGNTTPIFILPVDCHQSTNHHQQAAALNQGGVSQPTGQSTGFNYPPSIYCPPSFYPYPIPLPVYEPLAGQTRGKGSSESYGCCQRRQECAESKIYSQSCCCKIDIEEPHRCTATYEGTICSKRDCPASVSLQALASQFLSVPGIISCTATRLLLRKVPGSNITNTMEDTMDRAQNSISVLTKDQLLAESRNAQQVNALINLHMTTTPPANIVPLLTLLQLKVNVLKAQVESLINKKVMECQGYGYEIETSGPIDSAVLSLKTNEELRQLLFALRQKECDERVNVNFSPYYSQKVIAESRLNNVQGKIRQVEAEFDRRRGIALPRPTMTSRVVQQFSEARCTFDFAQGRLFEPYDLTTVQQSPDPFSNALHNPRRLCLKPRTDVEERKRKDVDKETSTTVEGGPSTSKDTGTGPDSKEKSVERRCSVESCSCDESSSDDSLQGKKKLRVKIDRAGKVRISSSARLRDVSLMKLAPNIVTEMDGKRIVVEDPGELESVQDPDPPGIEDTVDRTSTIPETRDDTEEKEETPLEERRKVSFEMKEDENEDTEDFEDKLLEIKVEADRAESEDTSTAIKMEDIKSEVLQERDEEEVEDGEDLEEKLGKIKGETDGYGSDDTWPVTKEEDVTSEAVQDVKLEIKEEGESDTDVWKKLQFEPKIKVEPASIESMETFDYQQVAIKKEEPAEDDEVEEPLLIYKTEMKLEPKGKLYVEPKQETTASQDVHVVEKKFNVSYYPAEESKTSMVQEAKKDKVYVTEKYITLGAAPVKRWPTVIQNRTIRKAEKDESRKENKGEKNLHIVSMVTGIEYDQRLDDYGRLMKTNDEKYRHGRNFLNDCFTDRKKSVVDENCPRRDWISGKVDPLTVADVNGRYQRKSTVTDVVNETDGRNKAAFKDMFGKDGQSSGEQTKGMKRFPPLKCESESVPKWTGTSKGIFRRVEVEPHFWKTIWDRSASYRVKTGHRIISAIYSMIENQLASFSSLVGKVPNFQAALSNLYSNKLSSNACVDNFSSTKRGRADNKEGNKTLISRNNDWILLPSGKNVSERRGKKVRKIKHSIIVDREKNCLLIGGDSIDGQLRVLSGKQPYKTCRSLLIRSRLKNSGNCRQEWPTFTVLKHLKQREIVASRAKVSLNS